MLEEFLYNSTELSEKTDNTVTFRHFHLTILSEERDNSVTQNFA